MSSRTYGDDGDVSVHGNGHRHPQMDGDVPVHGGGYWYSRIDEDVPVRESGYRRSQIDGDVPVRGSGYRHSRTDDDVLAAHNVKYTFGNDMDLPPDTMPTSISHHIPQKYHPRPVSRHNGETGSKTCLSTSHSKRRSSVMQTDPKLAEPESIWMPFGTLGGEKKKSKRQSIWISAFLVL